jgi:hypothetical protein
MGGIQARSEIKLKRSQDVTANGWSPGERASLGTHVAFNPLHKSFPTLVFGPYGDLPRVLGPSSLGAPVAWGRHWLHQHREIPIPRDGALFRAALFNAFGELETERSTWNLNSGAHANPSGERVPLHQTGAVNQHDVTDTAFDHRKSPTNYTNRVGREGSRKTLPFHTSPR